MNIFQTQVIRVLSFLIKGWKFYLILSCFILTMFVSSEKPMAVQLIVGLSTLAETLNRTDSPSSFHDTMKLQSGTLQW